MFSPTFKATAPRPGTRNVLLTSFFSNNPLWILYFWFQTNYFIYTLVSQLWRHHLVLATNACSLSWLLDQCLLIILCICDSPTHLFTCLLIIVFFFKGVWSPAQPTTSAANEEPPQPNPVEEQRKKIEEEPIPPVWTPRSAHASPIAERKEFRPVNFESPTLPRKNLPAVFNLIFSWKQICIIFRRISRKVYLLGSSVNQTSLKKLKQTFRQMLCRVLRIPP